jgi:ornithine cyclodeaminase/alanine dehydrogenase-like protein (mu-crystallin family)
MEVAGASRPPFSAEEIGSLLRPRCLMDAALRTAATAFRSVGIAVEDIAAARLVYETADRG